MPRWFEPLKSSRALQGAAIGAACALLMLGVQALGWLNGLNYGAQDRFFAARGVREPHPKIRILTVDDATVEAYKRWPLPWSVYAQALHRLRQDGAKTVAFDVLFSTPPYSRDEVELARACRESKFAVQASVFKLAKDAEQDAPETAASPDIPFSYRVSSRWVRCNEAASVQLPIPSLLAATPAVGYVNINPELGGTLRRIPHLIRYRGATYPSLALAAAAHYLDLPSTEVKAEGGHINLAGRHIPIDKHGESWINWTGANNSFPVIPLNRYLHGQIEPKTFEGCVVLIGTTAAGTYEHHATPFSPWQPATELQANALNDILLNQPLREVPPLVASLAVLALTMLMGWLCARGAGAGIAAAVAVSIVGWIAAIILFRLDWYMPVAASLLAVWLTCLACIASEQLIDAFHLKKAEERYALAARGTNEGLWDWNLQADTVYYAPRWKSLLGYGEADITGAPEEWFKRIHPEDRTMVRQHIDQHLQGITDHFGAEFRMQHRDGNYRWVLARGLAVRAGAGRGADAAQRMAGSITDITQRKEAEKQLLHVAYYDELTELPNRAYFLEHLWEAITLLRRRDGGPFAVIFLDLDEFRLINESFGHHTGDQFLIEIARRLRRCVPADNIVTRLGGDEFAILLQGITDSGSVAQLAEEIERQLVAPVRVGDLEVASSASIGVALSDLDYERPGEMMRDADIAMHRAKSRGRAHYAIFDQAMHERVLARLRMESDLRGAIERGEMRVFYQPIVSLETGGIAGFEALVRWMHPERGLVAPDEFIPLAEETGQIIALDQWMLREACHQVLAWQGQFGASVFGEPSAKLMISVNLSGRHFAQPDLVRQVSGVLAETGFEPGNLKLEITEGVIMHDAEAAIAMLRQLKELGIRLSVDDFGTGYSSLSYLHRFPLTTMKIDRSFISRIGPDGEGSQFVWTILSLARNLGLDVIAEGVETEDQLSYLRMLTCEYGQGYFFAKPLPATEAEKLLHQQPKW